MLSSVGLFSRGDKATAKLIHGLEWFTVNKDGKGCVMTTGPGSAPTPPDYLLMGLGACAGNGIKFLLDKNGIKYTKLEIEVNSDWEYKPQKRLDNIRIGVSTDAECDHEKFEKIVQQAEQGICPIAGTLLHTPKIKSFLK